jgi:hypothetical protein
MPYGTVNADVIQTSTSGGILGAGDASIMKNRIINGACVIDQRNAGASVTISDTGAITYTLDRWAAYGNIASKFSVQQNAGSITPPVGFKNYLGVTSLSSYSVSSSDGFTIRQYIEGYNVADLGWGTANAKTVTLSFQVYSSLTGTFGGVIRNGAANRSYPFTYTISSANTWTTATVTVAGDTSGTWLSTNGIGLTVLFGLGAGSANSGTAGSWASAAYESATGAVSVVGTNGATFYITGVQLEVGSSATGFEYRQYTTELCLCQRYFVSLSKPRLRGVADGFNFQRMGISLPVTMRTAPTVSLSGTVTVYNGSSTGTGTSASTTYSTVDSIELDINKASGTSTASTPAVAYMDASNTSVLTGSSEL